MYEIPTRSFNDMYENGNIPDIDRKINTPTPSRSWALKDIL